LGCQKKSNPQNFRTENKITEIKKAIDIDRTKHGKCNDSCNELLFCGHGCSQNCHKGNKCPPCKDKCAVLCEHTKKCSKSCLEPCAVCAKPCSWECKHRGKCNLSCGTPCYRLPCNEKCSKKLKCGHECAGVCGEICSFCVKCDPKREIKSQGKLI